jgi:uncharacterized protein (DUF1501 family)
MPVTRRQFIVRGAGLVSVSLVMPKVWLKGARAAADPNRRIFVVIQLNGGNDGLNTLVPYTNSRYFSLRPTLSFKDSELKDSQGRSTILGGEPFGLHPALGEIKQMYDAGKVAIVRGVGYPNPNLSHFSSMDIWHTADLKGGAGDGWLGKYADQAVVGRSGLSAVAIGGSLPKSFFADRVVIPNINNFNNYTFQTDNRNAGDRNNQINTFNQTNRRDFPADSFIAAVANTSVDAVAGAAEVQSAVGTYTSSITYPAQNPLAAALRMVAQVVTTIPDANLLYVNMGGFDNHSDQIGNPQNDPANKLVGDHANLLRNFSEGVKAFYDDLAEHGLAGNTVMMQWSEFGRRPNENASHGSDHGTASMMFVIGDPVRGGLYGEQPSLEATDLDNAGNMKFTVDFRAVYATLLDKWLGVDSKSVLGAQYENVGFLG